MNSYRSGWTLFCLCWALAAGAQHPISFTVVPLGVRGGLDESNLSAYMVAAAGSNDYICLDAGTIYAGIRKAVDSGVFTTGVSNVLKNYIKAYFISHPHLDHVAGLIMNSPEDSAKTIYGLPFCLDVLKEKYFTWESWANFGDEGEKPQLKKYHYSTLWPGEEIAVPNTHLYVQAFPLSHGAPYQSTAFLVRTGDVPVQKNDAYLLYLGDTGADTIEHSDKLHRLWEEIAPLVKARQLKAIFIEVSFPNEQPEKLLFGHLTPTLLQKEIADLAKTAGGVSLSDLPVVITHRKPSGEQEAMIQKELEADHNLRVKLIFPRQAARLDF
jgi:cAMP phosphodiesterase